MALRRFVRGRQKKRRLALSLLGGWDHMFVRRDQLALCILLSFQISACSGAAAQNDSVAVDPCSYGLPHYDEDWCCVRSAAHRADAVDAIK